MLYLTTRRINRATLEKLSLGNRTWHQVRAFTGTCVDNNAESCSEIDATSAFKTEPLTRDKFLNVLKLVCGKGDAFNSSLDSFRSEIVKSRQDSYPFKGSDTKMVLDLSTKLLLWQADSQLSSTLAAVVDLFKADADSTVGLNVCKTFASKSPTVTKVSLGQVLSRWFYNRMGMLAAHWMTHRAANQLNVKYKNGVKHALGHLYDCITRNDMEALQCCCEAGLFSFFKNGLAFLKRLNLKLCLSNMAVDNVNLDKFLVTIGGKRGDDIREHMVFRNILAHQIIVTPPKINRDETGQIIPFDRKQNQDAVVNAFTKGGIARMDVSIRVKQSVALLDCNNETAVWEDGESTCTHKLSFESQLNVDSFEQLTESQEFEWTLVDVNGVMCNNNPLT